MNCELILVSEDDADSFALNSVCIDDKVLVHYEAVGFIK